tara:strand:- start:204 stop:701 length:498 start_codon:yes stop_codon:yes gene_type:complete
MEKNEKNDDMILEKYTNSLIEKVNNHLSKFNYNVIIANMHETYNFLSKIIEKDISKDVLTKNYKNILAIFSPIIPHITFECLESLKDNVFQKWPQVDKELLDNEKIVFVIQINGKKRGTIDTQKDTNEKTLMELIKKEDKINKNLLNKKIKKIIFVKNRLINILI